MHGIDEFKERAFKAKNKKAPLGPDIDLDEFEKAPVPHQYMADDDLCALPEDEQQRLVMAGLDLTKKERGGTFFQKDTTVVHC
ncbi:MAG: SufD family Fe-S cluster assembly protein, partial [Desulfobacteraceae bacterium]|nr:SufD family Fe-S cluster assembly protein [Desulfobacteraceae bacterium]